MDWTLDSELGSESKRNEITSNKPKRGSRQKGCLNEEASLTFDVVNLQKLAQEFTLFNLGVVTCASVLLELTVVLRSHSLELNSVSRPAHLLY